jgi:hypothetical protein
MPELTEQNYVSGSPPDNSFIAGKPLRYYWRVAWFFIVLAIALEVIFKVSGSTTSWWRWLAVAVISLLMTLWLATRLRVQLSTVITANVFWGLLSGLALAILDIFWYHEWWYLFNIVRLPFLLSCAGLVIGSISFVTLQLFITKKQSNASKGGGMYGGKETSYR